MTLKNLLLVALTGFSSLQAAAQCNDPFNLAFTPTVICTGRSIQLNATSYPGATYVWTGPAGSGIVPNGPASQTLNNVQVGTHSGVYTVTMTYNGCNYFGQVNVPIEITPTINGVTFKSPVCVDEDLAYTANSGSSIGATFTWAGPNGWSYSSSVTNIAFQNSIQLADAGLHTVVVKSTAGCESDPFNFIINVHPEVKSAFTPEIRLGCEEDTVILTNGSSGQNSNYWQFGDGNTSFDFAPVHIYKTQGSYTIKLITGKEKEFTSGSIDRAIFMLSIPMILEMLMESLFAVVDVFFVGKLGVNAVATVGLTESMLTIIYSVGIGLSMGATALVARRTGEKDMDAAAHAAMQAIYVVAGVSLLISITGIFFAKDLLLRMGASEEMAQLNYRYTQIMLGSNFVIMLLFMINGIFRGAGDASIAMRSLWLANILNIVLCPLLINGLGPVPAFGLKGAALATTIGRGSGVLYQVYHLYKGKGLIRIKPKHIGLDIPVMGNLLKIAAGGTAQFLIASASWIFLIRILAHFGSNALAGYTIAIRVIVFAILPAWGMANAAATLVGQNLGAQQPERAEKSVWRTAYFNMLFLAAITVIFFLLARPIITIFNQDAEVVTNGTLCLRIVCLGYVFYAYGMVISQSFNGAGDTKTPTLLNIFGFWMFQIPLAYILAITLDYGPVGVFSAISVAESLIAVAAILVFRRGKWKTVKV